MKKLLGVSAFALVSLMVFGQAQRPGASTATVRPSAPATTMSAAAREAFVEENCFYCHNDKDRAGGFSFSAINLAKPQLTAEQAERVILKLRTGMMPPAGSPRPDATSMKAFITSLEADVDRAAAANPNPGRPSLHRLNRTEYRNAIRDLLGMEINVESLLPADDMSQGFDNMSEVLNISPTLMQAYISAAGKIGRLAVGDASMKPVVETYPVHQSYSQDHHVEGTPLGTRGGVAVVHNFPADGEYVFIVSLVFTTNTNLFGNTAKDEKIEVAVNGEQVALMSINPMMKVDEVLKTPPIKVKAGPQRISTSFIKGFNRHDGPYDDLLRPLGRTLGDISAGSVQGLTSLPHVRDLGISGPFNATGVSETPIRQRIFSCRPATPSEEEPCATKIINTLARQAFRKPVSAEHLEEMMSAYHTGRKQGDFDSGVRVALQLMLAHPEFVFRFEKSPVNVAPNTNYRITDLELASRLSFFLWSTSPDEELISVAASGKLRDPLVLEKQVRRMLADPKADSLSTNFAGQWLYLRNLKEAQPDVYLYPRSDENLLQSMRRETELLFGSIVREDRSIMDLLTADYTFVNESLAKHYRIPKIIGNHFQRVPVTDENRLGILGHGSILSVTSFSNRTSPVVRGKWVLEQVLGAKVPVPPPNVPKLEEISVIGGEPVKPKSVRERVEQHRTVEPCLSCHKIMDPVGLSLENFDAVGQWRTQDSGAPVDATGELVDGTKLTGPVGLRKALLRYSDAYTRNFTAKLLTFGLGRGLVFTDMPSVRAIERAAARNNYRFASIVMGIVKSTPFQMRRSEAAPETVGGAVGAAGRDK